MSNATPVRPEITTEVLDPETERILRERLATVDEDAKTAVDARQAVAEIRKDLLRSKKR